jgi:hypothetical protein
VKVLRNGRFVKSLDLARDLRPTVESWSVGQSDKSSCHVVDGLSDCTMHSLSKIFERIIYNNISEYLHNNNLIYEYQSGFIKGHDTNKQLLHITHKILSSNNGMGTRGYFLI